MSTRSLNKVLLIGNLTRDPELKYTPQGTAVCQFGLATNREWTDSSGQKQEGAEFHQIVAWGKLAEICSQILSKGRKVYVEGRLQTRSWKTPDGQDRKMTEVVMEEMIALDSPKNSNRSASMEEMETYIPAEEMAQVSPEEEVFQPEEEKGESKKATKGKKATSKDVADEIPF